MPSARAMQLHVGLRSLTLAQCNVCVDLHRLASFLVAAPNLLELATATDRVRQVRIDPAVPDTTAQPRLLAARMASGVVVGRKEVAAGPRARTAQVNLKSKGSNYGMESYTYSFSRVFSESTTQAAYFQETAGPMVSDLLNFRHKVNVVMAYGSSGSGKTFTIEGTAEEAGLIPRAIQKIFTDQAPQLCVQVSYYEVYNEAVYDLIAAVPPHQTRPQLKVRENVQGQVHVEGLLQVDCRSCHEALEVFRKASRLRQHASTGLNSCSSRSHAIFTALCSKIHFVDLAGSERAARTYNTSKRLRESACINSSLSTLGRCLQALRANSTAASSAHVRPVPYRECKLTHLFKDILHGEGALALLVCVSPLAADYEETHHVLKYAALASKIKVALPPPVRSLAALCPLDSQGISSSQHQEVTEGLQEQIETLEEKLGAMEAQVLAHNEMLTAAEVCIRQEVVQELECMVSELRLEYDEQLGELQQQLAGKDLELAALRGQLLQQTSSTGGREVVVGAQDVIGSPIPAAAAAAPAAAPAAPAPPPAPPAPPPAAPAAPAAAAAPPSTRRGRKVAPQKEVEAVSPPLPAGAPPAYDSLNTGRTVVKELGAVSSPTKAASPSPKRGGKVVKEGEAAGQGLSASPVAARTRRPAKRRKAH
ncbi:MAG: hypothetical protein WDW36_002126 [Sanguina aurantia]